MRAGPENFAFLFNNEDLHNNIKCVSARQRSDFFEAGKHGLALSSIVHSVW